MPYRDQYEDRSDVLQQSDVPWGATRTALIGLALVVGIVGSVLAFFFL